MSARDLGRGRIPTKGQGLIGCSDWRALRTDIENAGGTWVDEELHVDGNLATSRKPDDLPVFCNQLVEMMSRAAARSR